jgi:hypothetical protein
LRQIPDFPVLQQLNALGIKNNAALEQIAEFSGLLAVQIHHLPDGTTFREPLTDDSGRYHRRPDIVVSENPALRSFAIPFGWGRGGYVEIRNNVSLETLAFGEFVAIDRLEISENPSLHDVDLGVLDTVDTLSVYDNPLLSPANFDGVRTFEREMTGNAGQPPAPNLRLTPTP